MIVTIVQAFLGCLMFYCAFTWVYMGYYMYRIVNKPKNMWFLILLAPATYINEGLMARCAAMYAADALQSLNETAKGMAISSDHDDRIEDIRPGDEDEIEREIGPMLHFDPEVLDLPEDSIRIPIGFVDDNILSTLGNNGFNVFEVYIDKAGKLYAENMKRDTYCRITMVETPKTEPEPAMV